MSECRFSGCRRPQRADQLCQGHFQQQWRHWPLTPLFRPAPLPAPDGMAWCTTHQQYLPAGEFGRDRRYGTLWSRCRQCFRDAMAIRRQYPKP